MQAYTLHGSVGRCTGLCSWDSGRNLRRSAPTAGDAQGWPARRGEPGLLCLLSSYVCLGLDSHAVLKLNKKASNRPAMVTWAHGLVCQVALLRPTLY